MALRLTRGRVDEERRLRGERANGDVLDGRGDRSLGRRLNRSVDADGCRGRRRGGGRLGGGGRWFGPRGARRGSRRLGAFEAFSNTLFIAAQALRQIREPRFR